MQILSLPIASLLGVVFCWWPLGYKRLKKGAMPVLVRESGRFSSCGGFRGPEGDCVLPPRVSGLLQLSAE